MSHDTTSPISFRERFERANALWSDGRLKEAEKAYRELLKEDPSSSSAAARLGDIRLVRGDTTGAKKYFSRAIEINPKLPWGHIGLARIAEDSADPESAIAHYKSAIELSPDLTGPAERIVALANGIANARQKGRSKEAHAEFLHRFEEANQLMVNHQLVEAEAIYRELLVQEPNSAPLFCKLGGVAVELGRVAEARTWYDRAVAANHDFPWAHVGLSEIQEASGEFEAAINSLERALAVDASLNFALERIQSIRKKLHLEIERIKGVQIRHWPANLPRSAVHDAKNPRTQLTIVAWDLTHNPVGRALALAEMALHGADPRNCRADVFEIWRRSLGAVARKPA